MEDPKDDIEHHGRCSRAFSEVFLPWALIAGVVVAVGYFGYKFVLFVINY